MSYDDDDTDWPLVINAAAIAGIFDDVDDSEWGDEDLLAGFAFDSEEWRIQAACRSITVDGRELTVQERLNLFFPERGNRTHTVAKATCRACPVQVECEDFRLRSGTQDGIWGGKIAKRTRSK